MADPAAVVIIDQIKQNKEQPSVTFIQNIKDICRIPKDVFTEHFKILDINFISLLRKQLFYIFLDNFDSATLESNGFPTLSTSEEDAKKHLKWLKKRFNPEYASNDIFDMGYSILEGRIIDKLALNLLTKPPTITTTSEPATLHPTNVIDNNSKEIIGKLTEVLKALSDLKSENTLLKNHIVKLERKIDSLESTKNCENRSPATVNKPIPIPPVCFQPPHNIPFHLPIPN